MGTQNSEKTEETIKLTKQGVRDLNHLVPTKAPAPAEVPSLPSENVPAVSELVSVPTEL